MVFAGQGLVRWKGKKIANFMDGLFETNDMRVIQRLTELGFKSVDAPKVDSQTKETIQKWTTKTKDYKQYPYRKMRK